MSRTQVNLVLLFGLFIGSVTAGRDISSFFTTCKVHDPNLNECLKDAIQEAILKMVDGVEELNTPSIDPLFINETTIPAGIGSVDLEQTLKDIKIYNLARHTKINNVIAIVKPDGFEIDIDAFSAEVRMEAHYKVDGKILFIPVASQGECVIKLENIGAKLHIVAESIKIDGKVFGNIKSMDLDMIPEKVVFKFDDFFQNQSNLNRDFNILLNEKWQEVFNDVKHSYAKFISDVLVNTTNEVFHHIEFGSLFIE